MARRVPRVCAAAIAVALAFPGAGLAAERVTAAAYLERLALARAVASGAALDPSPARMDEVRAAWGLPLDVELGPSETVHVASDPLLASLVGAHAREFEIAAAHLQALEAAARAAASASPADRAVIREALRSAYIGVHGSPGILDRARRSLGAVVGEVVRYLAGFHGPGSVVAWAVVVAVAVGLIVLIRRLGVVPERARTREAAPTETAVDWAAEELAALARGDLAAAVRARYRLLVAALESRGVLDDAPSLTAGECRGAVRAMLPAAYPAVERATQLFELAAYAHAPLARDDVEAVRAAEREVRAA